MSTGRRATTAANGACRSALISRSRRRRRPGVSICVRSGIASKPLTRSSALVVSMTCLCEELDVRLNGFGWEDSWDNFTGPQAKAHHLLKGLDLGGAGSALRQAGQIIFEEFGGSPGNSYTWVELRDDLTVSLLQARLIELNLPINVAVGTRD